MIAPYDKRTEETRNRILGERRSYYYNKYYKSAEGNFYFYINTKGYFHIIRPRKVKYDGKFSHFEIVDYLLTKDNMLREASSGKSFKTMDDCIAEIESHMAEDA